MLRWAPALLVVCGCYLDWDRSGGGGGGPGPTTCGALHGRLFLISALRVGQADPAGDPTIVPGANLDDLVSTDVDPEGCFHADFTGPPPDDEPGVDNQLGPVLGGLGDSFDVDGGWRDAILRGDLLLLLRIRADDTTCSVEILRGQLPPGASRLAVDGGGGPLPDQTLDVLGSSVGPDGIAVDRYDETRVRDAHLRTISRPPVSLPLFVGDLTADLPILDSHVRFDLFSEGPRNGLLTGAPEVVAATEALFTVAPDIDRDLIRMIIEGQADIAPDERGECQRVSIGFVFETTPVTFGTVR